MYILNDQVAAFNDNPMNPDVYVCEIHSCANNSDDEVIAFVEKNAFCYAGGARITARYQDHAVVRYYA